ncbi:MAG: DUF3137 domain-containing protein [Bacillota bacterium]|nr:DUF3137 domain-containing protein [Bacillota bacterium]
MGLFGPSKREVWEQLSREINAEYVEGFWSGSGVQAHVDNWIIVLDTYTVSNGRSSTTYTRIRAPFVNLADFYFCIYRRGLFSDLGKLLGMQDIEIGYPEFDEDFILKGNDEEKVRQLLSDEKIRHLIEGQPRFHLEVKDDEGFFKNHFPEGVDELYFRVPGVIRDIDLLKELYELFAEALRQLCEIGAAGSGNPQVDL